MTKKDFIVIAKALNSELQGHYNVTHYRICKALAVEFIYVNPRFDRDRFMEACGYPDESKYQD